MENQICKYCNESFENVKPKVFSTHVRWCVKNPSRNNTQNISKAIFEHYNRSKGFLTEFEVICVKCGKKVIVKERALEYPKKEKYFCSLSCANKRVFADETKAKIKTALINRTVRQDRCCPQCNKIFSVSIYSHQKFCCGICNKNSRKTTDEYLLYKHKCQFKFNVWKYPKEFDLDLIKKYGWYAASNRGNNLGGVSRDHRISIKFGWRNNISPEIMAHPANCKLMVHSENISKLSKCSIDLVNLKKEIERWNKQYI